MAIDSNMLRVSGISSGIDTESVVESLLSLEKLKIDEQNKAITKLEWKEESLRDINLQLRNFREKYMSVLSPETNMTGSNAYNTFDVNILDTTSAVSVSANSSALEGEITIDSITQLAEAAQAESINVFNTELISHNTALNALDLSTPLSFDAGEISFSINGEVFTFSETDDLAEVIGTINNSDAGVTMRYSELKQGFSIVSDETGSASTVDIVNISGNAFDATSSAFGIAEGTYTGQDAMLQIEGIAVTKSSNSFTIDGIAYNLRDTSATSISFNVERNVQSTVDKIKGFIEGYNELVDSLQTKLDEDVHRTYEPLSEEEREGLTEKQQEEWEDMAKSGMFRNDSNISGLLSTLRESFYTAVESVGLSPYEIGLTTGKYSDKGKIFIDEEVLTSAVQENPEKVENIFSNTSYATDLDVKYKESGLINRISDSLNNYIKNANRNTIANVESALLKAEERLDALEDRYESREERYWKKYTAMETALSTMNSQISAMLGQLGMGTAQ